MVQIASKSVTVGGIRLSFSGLIDFGLLPASFGPFLSPSPNFDLSCDIDCLGPDPSLRTLEPVLETPWSFGVKEQTCEVMRRNEAGEALWQFRGSLDFHRAELSWHPTRFSEVFGSCERALRTGLGLSPLVLRLRTHAGLVIHGAGAELNGEGVLCTGVSGRGKSTISRLIDAEGGTVFTDERPIVRQWPSPSVDKSASPAYRIYGSPWPSSAGFARNDWAPLRRIFFIEHGATNQITPISPADAFRRLVQVTTVPWQHPVLLDPCLATIESLIRHVPCAVLSFRPTPEVVDEIRRDLDRPRPPLR